MNNGNNMVAYNQNQLNLNMEDEYVVSIVKTKPFRIEDTSVKLSSSPNSFGIVSFTGGGYGPGSEIIAHVINQGNMQNPMCYQGNMNQPTKFAVEVNLEDKVIGFIEKQESFGLGANMDRMFSGMQNNNAPLNIISFADLIILITQRQPGVYQSNSRY